MEQHKVEFSLTHFLKYALRYILVAVLCAAIGLGLGAMVAAKQEPVTLKKYTGELIIDAHAYAEAMNQSTPISEADYSFYLRKVAQIYETAKSPEVLTKTFATHKTPMYGSLQSEEARVDAFNGDLQVALVNDVLRVSFLHDAVSDAEHAAAQAVVNDFLTFARENVQAKYPEFADAALADTIKLTPAYEDNTFTESLEQLSSTPSILLYAAIGAVVGAILGAGLIFVLYLVDPRIKTLTAILPAEYTAVVDADKEGDVASFAALIASKGAKCVMLACPQKDEALGTFAEAFADYLSAAKKNVSVIKLTGGDNLWMRCFDELVEDTDLTLVLCEGLELGVLSFVAEHTDAAALLIHRGTVHEKLFRKNANAIAGCDYLCTVLHGKSAAYLD